MWKLHDSTGNLFEDSVLNRNRHRFLDTKTAERYGIDVPEYQGIDQIAEVPVDN